MNRLYLILSLCALLLIVSPRQSAVAESENKAFVAWHYPVGIPEDCGSDLQKEVEKLRLMLKSDIAIVRSKVNPGCCLWVDVVPWLSRQGESKFVVVIGFNGGLLFSSDAKAVELGRKSLESAASVRNGVVYLPIGVLTNFESFKSASPGSK